MESIGKLLVGHGRVVAVALVGAQRSLCLLQRLAGVIGFAFKVGGVEVPVAKERGQRLDYVAVGVGHARTIAALHDHARMAFIRQIKLGFFEVGVDAPGDDGAVGGGRRPHVHRGYVVGLIEVIEHHLPVAG